MDANWFLSTTAQTAGAVVAIVGGFLVTRLVSFAAEREGIQGRIRDIQGTLTARRQEKAATEEKRKGFLRESLMQALIHDLANDQQGAALTFLGENFDSTGLPYNDVHLCFETAEEAVNKAAEFFNSNPIPEGYEDGLESFLYLVGAPYESIRHDALEAVFSALLKASASRRDVFVEQLRVKALWEDAAIVERRDALNGCCDELSRTISFLAAEAKVLQERLTEVASPTGLRPLFLMLGYLAIIGIAAPLALLLVHDGTHPVWVSCVLLALFCGGLVSLVVALWRFWRDVSALL